MSAVINFDLESHKRQLYEKLKTLKGEYSVTIKRKQRTYSQLKYYWGVVIPMIAKEMGEDNLQGVHYWLKSRYCVELYHFQNKDHYRVKETAELTTTEFMEYIDTCKKFAAENLNLFIPGPS